MPPSPVAWLFMSKPSQSDARALNRDFETLRTPSKEKLRGPWLDAETP